MEFKNRAIDTFAKQDKCTHIKFDSQNRALKAKTELTNSDEKMLWKGKFWFYCDSSLQRKHEIREPLEEVPESAKRIKLSNQY